MRDKEKEWIKAKIDRDSVHQIKAISGTIDISFEELLNRVIRDGLSLNQPDFLLRNEILKVQTLDKKMSELYPFLAKNYRLYGQNYLIMEKVLHFLVDLRLFLDKKKLEQSDFLVISKAQDILKYVQSNYNGEFQKIKAATKLQERTKLYKLLFGRFGNPNQKTIPDTLNTIRIEKDENETIAQSEIRFKEEI